VYPVFVPSSKRAVTDIVPSDNDITVLVGAEIAVEIKLAPLGSPLGFLAVSDDTTICVAEIVRNSVVIRGIAAGPATVTVTSTSDSTQTVEIDVTVTLS
jgi:hypothetical protein